ncbi:MAG: PAS domain S-box protein [Pyrinomonadaceae bacterium]
MSTENAAKSDTGISAAEDFEVALKELSEIRYALAESTIVAFTDQTGKITYVNDKFCRISKYSREELIGQDHRIINSGYHPGEFFRNLWTTIANGKIWRGDICNRAKDGSLYWVATTIVPFLNKKKKPYQYVAIRHDITRQKVHENELQRSEYLLREQKELLEQTHDAIYSWRLNDGIIYWNKSAENLYGYGQKEVFGKEVYEVLKTEYEYSFENYLEKLKTDGYWEGEIVQTTKDGRKIIVESRQAIRLSNDGEAVVLETSRDITERKVSQERIRQQASLLEKTSDAILVCDLNHKLIFWNNGAEKLYGWSSEEVLGEDICKRICSGERRVIEKALEGLEKSDEWQEETINFTSSGKEIIVISRWTLVRNDLGKPDYYLIVNTDATELKRTEQQLLRAQRLESIGTLAGGIAHDLNNVLSPILMAVDMLESDPDLPDTNRPWLSIIRENTARGADLIKQVLTFARGSADGNREHVQVSYLIKELISVWKKTFPANIGIKYEIATDLPLIHSDSTQIHQMLMNLAVNAKDAMKETGGILKITAGPAFVDEELAGSNTDAEPGNYVLITVEDSGTGMTAETLERIWDPFFTTKDIGEGTGLGLSTTLSIIKANRGFVDVHSEQGKGTKFSVFLPAAPDTAAEVPAEENADARRGNGELILIVDDEEHIRQVTSATLEKFGYKTITAADGNEAIAILSSEGPVSLVITDMAMPKMDGEALIKTLRETSPEQKIIAVSGLTTAQQTRNKELSVDDFLAKPYTSKRLLSAVAKVIFGIKDR